MPSGVKGDPAYALPEKFLPAPFRPYEGAIARFSSGGSLTNLLPVSELPGVRKWLGLNPFQRLACPAQLLIRTAMPCSGLGECGVCAVATRVGWALACSDGPVFDFNTLEW